MKRFLVIFRLPQPRAEHARLKKDLERYSGGNTQVAFTSVDTSGQALMGYFFTSALPLREMTFDGSLLFEDSYLLVEIGEQAASERFGDAMSWLRTYRFR